MITKVNPTVTVVDKTGRPTRQLQNFLFEVAETSIITGDGTPEGSVEAGQARLYMDTSGTTGAILYIKKDADVGGDRSLGWILV